MLRSPVTGYVVRRHKFTGESVRAQDSIIEVLEDGTLEAILYVPQSETGHLKSGERVSLSYLPDTELLSCVVLGAKSGFESPPECIERHYRHREELLPVRLRPMSDSGREVPLRLGATVRLPSGSPWHWSDRQ